MRLRQIFFLPLCTLRPLRFVPYIIWRIFIQNWYKQWGLCFANNFYWVGNRDNIANLMMLESTAWSVGNGIFNGFIGLAGIPADIRITLYSNVKLASALFALYGIDDC